MNKIPLHDIIGCQSYYQLCDYDYEHVFEYPTGVVHCHLDHITEFFDKIKYNKEKYIVVSSRSDFGLCYQSQFPIWADTYKAVKMFASPAWGCQTLQFPARCGSECDLNDRYSIKMYMWTKSTFNEIPQNVLYWFVVNNCVNEPQVEGIPFGINNTDGNTKFFDIYKDIELKDKEKTLYINFQFYTNERKELFEYFKYGTTIEKDIPFEQYINGLNIHKFCLCPVGNGIDCYRIWESLYMGCIPIIEAHPGFEFLKSTTLPILMIDNFHRLTSNDLNEWYKRHYQGLNWSLQEAQLSYWKEKINDRRNYLQ